MKFFIILLLFSCSKSSDPSSESEVSKESIELSKAIMGPEVEELKINVFYEASATPYDGSFLFGKNVWEVTNTSVSTLFERFPGRIITTPYAISEMNEINDISLQNWSAEQLLSLGDSISPNLKSSNKINVSIVYLKGF